MNEDEQSDDYAPYELAGVYDDDKNLSNVSAYYVAY